MKKPQWITLAAGICLLTILYFFGNTIPPKKSPAVVSSTSESTISVDSLIEKAKKSLSGPKLEKLNSLEHLIVRGDLKDQQIKLNHQLYHFWRDSANNSELSLWYQAEAARLENSEKSLTFAAHQFLDNLVEQSSAPLKQWEAFQAKDLFERSLKLNPDSDSSKVGLGAVYLFGGIASPMQGISMIKGVVDKDSTNEYAQSTLGIASLMSGQLDKAVDRFKRIAKMKPKDPEAIYRVATLYEQMGNKAEARNWYSRLLPLLKQPEAKNIQDKIAELSK